MRFVSTPVAVAVLAGAVALVGSPRAEAQDAPDAAAKVCSDAYVHAQELRLDKRLIDAKGEAAACMAATCPEFVTRDCARWLDELEIAIPSVVLRYIDAQGRERNDVTVTVDGKPFAERLDGSAKPIDPGPHVLEFRAPGAAAVQRKITISEGVKHRQIEVSLRAPDASGGEPRPQAPAEPPSVHPAAWALYGLSITGVAAFAGLAVHSLSLEDCEPYCTDDQVDDVVLVRALADVSLGVAVLALGGAIWITVASLSDGDDPVETALSAGIVPTTAGPVPGLHLSF